MTESTNGNISQRNRKQLEIITESSVSGCGCSTASCCDESNPKTDTQCCDDSNTKIKTKLLHGTVTIDGQLIEVTPFDNNIVELASRAKIKIPALCYHNNRSKGCCSACVVEIDGEQKFACSTIPENGMNIVVDRPDLKLIRKQRLLEYKEGIKSGNPCECSLTSSGDCCG